MIPKFRAWVKPGVLSKHPDGVVADAKPDFLGMTCLVKRDDLKGKKCFTEIIDFEDIELMQSTELNDKDGVEIFTGQIVAVKFSESGYHYFEKIVFENGAYLAGDEDWLYNVKEYCTVCGNIYENPELLESANG